MNPDNADIENSSCASESLRVSERQWREVFARRGPRREIAAVADSLNSNDGESASRCRVNSGMMCRSFWKIESNCNKGFSS
jgi:hypothetical protein